MRLPIRLFNNRDQYLKLHKHLFTFSSGPRSCMGRELAMASKSIPSPLSSFEDEKSLLKSKLAY